MDPVLDNAPCGYFCFGDDGTVRAMNATLARWLGDRPGGWVGQSVQSLLPLAGRVFYQTHFFPQLRMAGSVEEIYLTLRTASGSSLPTLVNAKRLVRDGETVNDCAVMVVRQRSRYEDEILKARRAAEEAQAWLSTTLRSIGDAVIATDENGNIAFLNPVAEELTGWVGAEALGRPLEEVFVIVNETTGLSVESPVRKVLRERRVVGLANHTALISRDGRRRPIDDSGAPIRGADGTLKGVVLVFRDISERWEAERELDRQRREIEALNQHLQRAMTETHHRVKNNLQIISALVDLQIASGNETVSTAELERLSQHIHGMAVLHDLLTRQARQGDPDNLSARAVLEQLLPILQGMARERNVQMAAEDRLLPLRQVTALAVLANELVSNATKHGRGDIGVRFSVATDRGTFEVTDGGDGFPPDFDPRTASKTGLDLLDTVCRHDLHGEIRYENGETGGARVVVEFPVG